MRATGEIGPISIRKIERVRKGVRVEFLCGSRASRRARADYGLLSLLAAEFSAGADELPRLIASQREEIKEANATSRELQGKLDLCCARELYAAATRLAQGIVPGRVQLQTVIESLGSRASAS